MRRASRAGMAPSSEPMRETALVQSAARGREPAMANAPAVLGLIALDRRRGSLQRQLYARLREHILSGRLAPGTRLPASRVVAGDLGVARNTVVAAFAQLAQEGYLTARQGSGTRVAELPPEALLAVGAPAGRAPVAGRPARLARRGRAWLRAERPAPD